MLVKSKTWTCSWPDDKLTGRWIFPSWCCTGRRTRWPTRRWAERSTSGPAASTRPSRSTPACGMASLPASPTITWRKSSPTSSLGSTTEPMKGPGGRRPSGATSPTTPARRPRSRGGLAVPPPRGGLVGHFALGGEGGRSPTRPFKVFHHAPKHFDEHLVTWKKKKKGNSGRVGIKRKKIRNVTGDPGLIIIKAKSVSYGDISLWFLVCLQVQLLL